jgi:cytoplasmic iron level regulating protein YaaA (DUF328/UPF0246 family)
VTERPYVLLPPSQAKSAGGRRVTARGAFDDELATPRHDVAAALGALIARGARPELESTLSAKGELLERAITSTTEVVHSSAPLKAAWRRYEGVVWTHVAPETLASSQRRRILVPSGLYGLLAGEDLIADYRIKMNASLAPMGVLATFWRPFVTRALDAKVGRATLVNLLPNEHAASIDLGCIGTRHRVINVRFVTNDERSAVGHDAKAVKGTLARRVLEGGAIALERFSWQGWRSRREGDEVFVTAPTGPRRWT